MVTLTPTEMLAEIKVAKKLSEVRLARLLDVSQPTVNRILNGQEGCSSKVLLAIQRAYADIDEISGESPSPAASEPTTPAAA